MKHRKETEQALEKLTLEEKAALLGGKNVWETHDFPRLDIPSITFSDGSAGLRRQFRQEEAPASYSVLPATCFPSSSTLANSWDPALAELEGEAIGEEAASLGVDVLLGPGMNIKRNPLCGRNFEYFSEDPYLAGKLAAGYVRGVQKKGGFACLKHFAVNSQETHRMVMNAVVDERALREIYLTGFEIAVEEGKPGAVMTSYNEVNGEYANENTHLLKEILRGEWGYEGLVLSDWGGSNDSAAALKAGSDLEMPNPGYDSARALIAAYEAGTISMEEIDARAASVLDAVFSLREIRLARSAEEENREQTAEAPEEQPAEQQPEEEAEEPAEQQPEPEEPAKEQPEGQAEQPEGQPEEEAEQQPAEPKIGEEDLLRHHETAKQIAAQSIVLLKNEKNLLPLQTSMTVAIVGEFAGSPRYQGAGSSGVNSIHVENVLKILDQYQFSHTMCEQGYKCSGVLDEELTENALSAAAKADVVLFFFGLEEQTETEGRDRSDMRIPENQIHMLEALGKSDTPVVGVLCAGSPVEMPWIDWCDALLFAGLGGEAGAGAVLDVLTGKTNPSGRLSETFPLTYEEVPSAHWFAGAQRDEEYRESIYVGYRYFSTVKAPVRFPFGYGLSYTAFAYSDLKAEEDGVSFILTNAGSRDGAETAQLYVSLPGSQIFRAKRELKGFCKVFLKAGESRQVSILFDDRTFRYWNVKTDSWEREGGTYTIEIGASSEDIRLRAEMTLTGSGADLPYSGENIKAYRSGRISQVTDQEYAAVLGRNIQYANSSGGRRDLTKNDAVCQMSDAKSALARLTFRVLNARKGKKTKNGTDLSFICSMPFRTLAKISEGKVSMEMVDGILQIVNGHFFRGLKKVIGGNSRNRKANIAYEEKLENAGEEKEEETA